jgi:hypothetical protein
MRKWERRGEERRGDNMVESYGSKRVIRRGKRMKGTLCGGVGWVGGWL